MNFNEISKRGAKLVIKSGIKQIVLYFPENGRKAIEVQLASAEIPIEWLTDIKVTLTFKNKTETCYQTEIDPLILISGNKKWIIMFLVTSQEQEKIITKKISLSEIESLKIKKEEESVNYKVKEIKPPKLFFEAEIDENFENDLAKIFQEQNTYIYNYGSKIVLSNLNNFIYFMRLRERQITELLVTLKNDIPAEYFKAIQVIATIKNETNEITYNTYKVKEVSFLNPFVKVPKTCILYLTKTSGKKITNDLIKRGRIKLLTLKGADSEQTFSHYEIGTFAFKKETD